MRYIFSNCPQDFLKNVDKLPDDMIYEIYAYLPKIVTMFLTKENYLKDHHLLKTLTNKRHIENYIRTMVRQDNEFVFKQLLVENHHRWIQMTKYYYKNCIYSNYLTFIESYAIDNESTKCRRLLCEFLLELGLSKNQHKKNIVKYIRWRT
jgi:hypothetical protein